MKNAMQRRRWFVGIALVVASSLCSGPIPQAQSSSDKPLILEVTWKAETRGRGVASIIRAEYEVQEHYQVVSCGGGPLPSFEGIKDAITLPALCINRLDGHIVRAQGHGAGDDEAPAYAYQVPDISSAGVPAPGQFNATSDGKVEIILRPGAGNPVIYGTNGSAEESLGCDGDWSYPRLTYVQMQGLPTLDFSSEHPAVTEPARLESCNPGTISIHIRATGPKEEVEAILIPPDDYDGWTPQGGDDEDTAGNGMLVKVKLQKKDRPGEKPRAKAKSFKFELTGVSKEPGVCLNWPSKAKTKPDPDFDLKIDQHGNPSLQVASDGQSATGGSDLQESSVTISSYDWGGWGSLKVTAELDNNQTVVAHLQNQPDIEELKIPKDDNDNHIADEWEQQFKDKTAESDEDKLEYQELAQGDGLSLYEEYRGFRVQGGAHIRTDPDVPDVFVYDQDDIGTGNLPSSGLAVHSVDRNEIFMEIDPDPSVKNWWIINFNSHNANLGKQHAIWLQDADPGIGNAGIDVGGPGPPKTSLVVKVGMDPMKRAGFPIAYMLNTISHELAHAANVWHHGDNDYSVRQIWKLAPDGTWAEVPTPKGCKPTDNCYGVAAQGGQESGVQNCIMRYEQNDLYEWNKGPYRWTKGNGFQRGDFYGNAQPSGTLYCRAVNGTGVNGRGYIPAPMAGDATNGNCEAQFCTNDLKRCWFTPTYAKH